MSWKKALSILAVGALLGVSLGTLADDRNDRNRRDNDRYDRDRHERERAEREAAERRKKAERDARYESQLIARYSTLTGSAANATSLVKGLHNDTLVTLTRITTIVVTVPGTTNPPCPAPRFEQPPGCGQSTPPTTTTTEVTETESFNPPTRPLHYKGVAIALAIMEAKLKDANPGITAATPAQIKEVLVGTPNGILTLRGAKKSWFRIAQLQGFAVGGHAGTAKPKQVNKKGGKYDHDNDDDDDDDD